MHHTHSPFCCVVASVNASDATANDPATITNKTLKIEKLIKANFMIFFLNKKKKGPTIEAL